MFGSDQAVADETFFGAVGLAVVREAARAVGVTALPGPIFDSAADLWQMHQFYMGRFEFVTASGIAQRSLYQVDLDSKAQRKIVDGDALVLMLESPGAGEGSQVAVSLRLLFKLH